MKRATRERAGELYALSQAALWSVFPIITKASYQALPPLFSCAVSTLFSVLFFAPLMSRKRVWHELRSADAWRGIAAAAFFIGIMYYGLIFAGLSTATAGTSALLLQMELLFSFMILRFMRSEQYSVREIGGGALMLLGGILVLFPGELRLQTGDLLILSACVFPPLGNHYAKRARETVSSETIMFGRSLVSGVCIGAAALAVEPWPAWAEMQGVLPMLAVNGIVLFGFSKLLWMEAIHRITISKALALSAISPALTLIAAYFTLGEKPHLWQAAGFFPIFFGVWFLTSRYAARGVIENN